jgi:hypothetical protein
MKKMYCWRCDMELPMLDEQEFEQLSEVLSQCIRNVQQERESHSKSLGQVDIKSRFQPALDLYEGLTGFKKTNPNALWHHRVSIYGPPCPSCGLPLRTPRASLCPKC